MEGAQTITLVCSSNIWVPLQQFPPCKPEVNRYCDLRLTGPNQAYCIDKEIRRDCDITCDGKFQGRYSCSPGQTWTPPLPYCVHPTDCQDPGIPEGANRTNANGFDDSLPRTYREGESVHFSCKEKDSLLHGPEIITCGSNATWSNSLPRCEGYRLG
ncbi:hypothetical protein AVEN_122323-1 [Araneus ventricosus]|uniref:Sushi domain-containing protein n=1 Tax=Araneus ventricosus TaxID=182803 RepID=A0A4Y2L2B9_ARAVE|nr:hypothetical protein AVEN_122323-1 [Araneus ventricosus]